MQPHPYIKEDFVLRGAGLCTKPYGAVGYSSLPKNTHMLLIAEGPLER